MILVWIKTSLWAYPQKIFQVATSLYVATFVKHVSYKKAWTQHHVQTNKPCWGHSARQKLPHENYSGVGSHTADLEHRWSKLRLVSHALFIQLSSCVVWGTLNEPCRGLKVQTGKDYSNMQSLTKISCVIYSSLLPYSWFASAQQRRGSSFSF